MSVPRLYTISTCITYHIYIHTYHHPSVSLVRYICVLLCSYFIIFSYSLVQALYITNYLYQIYLIYYYYATLIATTFFLYLLSSIPVKATSNSFFHLYILIHIDKSMVFNLLHIYQSPMYTCLLIVPPYIQFTSHHIYVISSATLVQ